MIVQTTERRRHVRGTTEGGPTRRELEGMIVGMYGEMPGLSLFIAQAARLFGLRPATCQMVLDDLVRKGRLRRATDGQYARPS
jgi:hypothetical protein